MKNLKYILYFFTLALIFSCGEDDIDSVTNDGVVTDSRQVFVGFTDNNDGASISESGGTVTYTISLNEALSSDAVITLEMTSSDGSVEASFDNTVTIPRGSTSVDVLVSVNDDGLLEDGLETYTLTITDVQYTLTNTVYLTLNNAVRSVNVLDLFETIAGDVIIRLDWTDASRDMDLFLVTGNQDFGGSVVDSSLGTTNSESVTFPGSSASGADFSVFAQEWPSFGGSPVSLTLTMIFPDNQERTYDVTITQNSWLVTFKKLEIGSVTAYSITQL